MRWVLPESGSVIGMVRTCENFVSFMSSMFGRRRCVFVVCCVPEPNGILRVICFVLFLTACVGHAREQTRSHDSMQSLIMDAKWRNWVLMQAIGRWILHSL